jgi:hypothetical protein
MCSCTGIVRSLRAVGQEQQYDPPEQGHRSSVDPPQLCEAHHIFFLLKRVHLHNPTAWLVMPLDAPKVSQRDLDPLAYDCNALQKWGSQSLMDMPMTPSLSLPHSALSGLDMCA